MTVRDLPDYTREMTLKFTGGFIGLEELAARLRSPVPWDLRGNVVLMEDFESELTDWPKAITGVGSSVTRTGLFKYCGDWSVKLTSGGTAGNQAYIYRKLPLVGSTKMAIFCRLGLTGTERQAVIAYYFGSPPAAYYPAILIRPYAQELYYRDQNGNFQLIDDSLYLTTYLVTWFPVLLVVDFTTGYYVKVVVNNRVYDLTDKKMRSTTIAIPTYDSIDFGAEPRGGVGTSFYVDGIIVAKNIPG